MFELVLNVAAFLAAGGKLAAVLRMKLYHPVHDDDAQEQRAAVTR